jgi:cyclic nucleotide gated channel, plant
MYLIVPLSNQIIKAAGVVAKSAWGGAAYNLLLYMLASHVCPPRLPSSTSCA